MNHLTAHEKGLNPKIEMFRKDGKWHISVSLPRWLLNDLEYEAGGNVTLVQSSSAIVAGSSLSADARITFSVKRQPIIQAVPAPEDYEPPPEDKVFQVGDYVMTPDQRSGKVSEIRDGYVNRADQKVDRPMYHVDTQLPGTPRVWWFGHELILIKSE